MNEPQRTNNALLFIDGLPGGLGADKQLTLSLVSFPIPKFTVAPIEVPFLNEKRKFAGNPVYDDLSVVYKDWVDKDTHKILNAWRYLVHNPETGQTGRARDYKKSGHVSLYSPDGEIERQYALIGVWPSAMDPGEIDMGGEDTVNITMTLTIDKAIPSLGLSPDGSKFNPGLVKSVL